ncbi:lipid A export permease/ATP-binding protein MsbA [Limnohabitans sp. 2KL-17]|uniref:lipid A export permease/ATP-binding protein MsbA n=1 Tax=Limnohabitans sp. 2KL-17 TaxID=1100704 RepID=UPI000D3AD5C5|nr:lipid A export permease/ATP-binding protein MsbA [Limnohabitans sp. 2KL-17]PUE62625.1 lipid A export permease/ATP-binding protein MsbA [Limnohabitans sp. 2KL-17]
MSQTPPPSNSPSSIRGRLQRLVPYFGGQRGIWAVAILATLMAALTEPMIPALFQPLLDKGFSENKLPLWTVPAAVVGLFTVRGIANFIAQYALSRLTNDGMEKLRSQLFAQLMKADLSLFSKQSASALSNTIVYEVQTGASQLVSAVISLARDSFTLIALLGYLMWLNWKLTLVVFTVAPGLSWIIKALSRRLYRLTKESQSATDDLAYVVEENVLAHRVVRLQGGQAHQTARFGHLAKVLRRLALKTTVASAGMAPLTQIMAALSLSMVLVIALYQSQNGASGATVGGFVAFITAMLMLIAPIKRLAEISSPITRGLAALERGLALLHEAKEETQGTHTISRAQGAVAWQDVHLQFSPDGQPALSGVTLKVNPGETVAFVGTSGAGKTTLVQLLPRFVQPSSGEVSMDGVPLQDWDLTSLRQQIAMVSQDVVMLNDTVAANVCLGHEANKERIEASLKAANLWDHILQMPLGVDTLLGHNASQLSGGQRQRLAIARALYKDAPILILDEATSALDNESERLVQDALQKLMQGRTTLIVAHRLTTIEHADRVVVMAKGRIVEQGTPAELLAKGGAYARLHHRGEGAGEEM